MAGPATVCCCNPATGGYKHVVAIVNWMGRYGYAECSDQDRNWWDVDPCPGSVCSSYIPYSTTAPDHKYLTETMVIYWIFSNTRDVTGCTNPAPFSTANSATFNWTRTTSTNRYTKLTTITDVASWDETILGASDIHLTGADAIAMFISRNPPYTGVDSHCSNIQPAEPSGSSGYTLTSESVTDTGISVTANRSYNVTTHSACITVFGDSDTDTTVETGTFTINSNLTDLYTASACYTDAINLLALWDLHNDVNYPWRTSCAGDSYHYGALVTYDYGGTGAVLGGPSGSIPWFSGPTGYSAGGMSGGSVHFREVPDDVYGWNSQDLIVGKWAEKKITIPRHNYARPCGPTDVAAVDGDLAVCWPGIANPCVDPCNNTTSTGDYTTLERIYNTRARNEALRMNNMAAACPGGSPCSDAHAYTVPNAWDNTCTQRNAASGHFLVVSPNTEGFAAGTHDTYNPYAGVTPCDDKYGTLWFYHVRQAMPDPLAACSGAYPSTPPLMEESRCASPGGCPSLPAGCDTPNCPWESIFYCPDSHSYSDLMTCGFQDDYGIQCPPL